MQQRLLGLPRMLAVFVLGVGLAQGSIYSQYTLDGPAVEDTYGRTDSEKRIALGSGDDAVCGRSYHARSRDFISLQASVGAPTGNADFSVAGYVKPVTLKGSRALFAIGATRRERRANGNGQWGAWVWVSRSGRLGMRTTTTATRSRAMLRPGVWAHVVLTYAAAETELRLWVDGKVVLTRRVAMDLRQNSSRGGMFIGAAHTGWTRGEFFIDHVSFANHTVTDVQEVAAPCLGGPSPTRAPTPVPRTRAPTPAPTPEPTPVPRTRAPATPVPPPATPAPAPTPDNAAVCAQKGSVCGPIRDGAGNTVDCGDCDDGKTCSFGRCEATCTLPQYANKRGPFDSLFAYVPLQFTYEDLSEYEHSVEVQLLANDRRADTFPYESAVDMTDKVVEVDFGIETVAPVATLSFKLMPQALGQSGVVLTFGPLTVSETDGKLSVTVGGVTVVSSAAESLSHRRCNHVAVQLSGDRVATFVNGVRTERAFGRTALRSLGGSLVVGRYPGKVWDVRVYKRALAEAEIAGLGDDCGSALGMALPDAGYPNYMCGVYKCIYWPAGVTDTTQESFDYQLSGHDMTWEHNVLETGMYVHGALCAEIAKPRDLLLTEGYRRSWVSKFNFGKPWNQYVLHENFHAYQKRARGSTKFLAESTASWGAFSQKPTAYDTILGMYTLQPQLALWTTQSSVFEDGIIDIGKGGHQYGAAIWEWYVTHHVLGDDFFIGKVYNRRVLGLAPTSGAPAEGMYNALREAGFDMRDVFSDFAARVTTWDVDYEETFRRSEAGSFRRLNGKNKKAENPVPDSEVDNKIAESYSVEGAGAEWVSVPDRYRIGDWAFNAYEVDVTAATTYQVGIKPSTENPAYSEFRAQAVVHNTETGKRTYHKLPVTEAGVAVTVAVRAAAGEKLYLVVANTPSAKFNGFEAYTYEYLLTPQTGSPRTPAPTRAPTSVPRTRAPTTPEPTRAPTPVPRTRAPTPVPTRAPPTPPPTRAPTPVPRTRAPATPVPTRAPPPATPAPAPTPDNAAVCAQKGSVCGPIRDGAGNTVDCGDCDDGETCSFGRCEATCTLPQYANKRGPFDSLFAYVPLQFTYEDLSEYEHTVEVQLLANDRRADTFPYECAVDMTDKVVEVDFGSEAVAPVATLSFKLMPQALGQSGVVLTFGPLTVSEADGKLSVTVGGVTVVSSAAESLSHRRCNHVAVQLSGDRVATFVNGVRTERAFGRTALRSLGGSLVVGRYPGKVWDVRVYKRALAEAEIAGLGDDCGSALGMALPDAGYPNYMCGVYKCIYWPAGVTDTTQESFDYQLSGHDMTWEHNVLETGMYVHGALCAEIAKPRDLLLTEGYRRSWVSKFNFGKPWNQYVLHENFHAYQKRARGSTKFLAESTASWGAFSQKPTAYDTILGMYTLQPQLALWTTQSSVFEDGIIDIGKGGHQYGAAIWEWYVTHHVLGDDFFIGKVYNRRVLGLAPTSGAPAEGMYNALREAGFDMRDVFSDFAARVTTWDVDYEETFRRSEAGSFRRLNGKNKKAENPVPDSEVDNKIAESYSVEGAGAEWVSVPDRYRIGDWAFNAYEVDVTAATTYQVGIKPSTENPAYSEFRAQAVVHNTETGKRTYHKLPVTEAGVAVTVAVRAAAGEKLYLVVANTPSAKFNGFEAYTYEYLLTPQTGSPRTPAPTAAPTRAPTPVPRTRAPATPEPATPVPRTRAPTPVPRTRAPAPPPPAPTQPVDGRARVFLLAGQSNMVGHGKAAGVKLFDPTLLETRDDVFAKSIIEVRRPKGPLAPRYGKAVGPELGFGHVLGDTFADDVYLFKAAKGGTQIANPEHWAPEGDAGNLYKQAIAGFKQFLADDVPADHVVSGFVWFQGYNDAFSDANANGYEAALVKLIASVRRDLGVADLPVVVVQGNDNQGVRGNIIRAAQAKVATEDAHADWVVSDDLYHYFHYDGPSMATIGRRAGQAMLPLLGRPGAFKDVYVGTQGETLQVAGRAGVLANDRGASAGQARVVATASHGELSLRSDGGFTYRPAAGFVGLDTFTYAVADTATGAVGNPAVVEVWVETKAGSDEKLIMHYSFDEAGVAADSSSSSPSIVYDSTKRVQAHADPTGVSVGEADGVSGKCAVLSGTQRKWNDGHLKVQMSPMPDFLLFGLDDITVCMWVKVAAPTTDKMTIFSNAGRPTKVGLTLLTDGPGKSFATVVYGVDGRKVTVASGGPAIDDGEWHHVAAVVSRSTNTATNYVDGQPVSTASISAVAGVFEQGYYTRFGGVAWLASHPKFVGHMDEARVYRTALPAARIAQLFAGRM